MKVTETNTNIQEQHQDTYGMEDVPLNAEQDHRAVVATIGNHSVNYIINQPVTHPDYKKYFKLKLNDSNQNCMCGFDCIHCCTLWVGAHIWFAVWFILDVINFVNAILNVNIASTVGIMNLILCILCLIAIFFGIFGLYLCQPVLICIFYLFMSFYIFLAAIVTVSILWTGITAKLITIFAFCIINIVLALWCLHVFKAIYNWARYFRKGGLYDENIKKPTDITKQLHLRPPEKVDLYI